jgi:hypothetical protein
VLAAWWTSVNYRGGPRDPQHRSAPRGTALCRLEIRGSPPAGVTADIGRRFGPVEVVAGRNRTALRVLVRDQAALRSLLTLLWDRNQEVLLVRVPARARP